MFRDTFKALEQGEVIGVFPEGTSYTEPGIAQVKDGASRAALEYMRWLGERGKDKQGEKLQIIPVGIVYTDKSQYQSRVRSSFHTVSTHKSPLSAEDPVRSVSGESVRRTVLRSRLIGFARWGQAIDVDAFVEERLSQDESLNVDSREVIKALTAEIEQQMLKLTINAPDW